MKYNVTFGSAFAVDQFGFVGKGAVSVGESTVSFEGRKSWSTIVKLLVFLAITLLPLFLFGFGLGWLLALVVIHYFCTSKGALSIQRASIEAVELKGRQLKFQGIHPETGKIRKTVFKAESEQAASSLADFLR